MKFHLPSFVLGYVSGVGSAVIYPKVKPALLEAFVTTQHLLDMVAEKSARLREDVADLWAEARARVRADASSAAPSDDEVVRDVVRDFGLHTNGPRNFES